MCIVVFVSSACIWIEVRGVYERRGEETHPLVWCGVVWMKGLEYNTISPKVKEFGLGKHVKLPYKLRANGFS